MSAVEDVRSRLIRLESEQVEEATRLLDISDEQIRLEKERLEYDERVARRRAEIVAVRQELEREENLSAARQQAVEVAEGIEELETSLRIKAEGHEWYEGIFPHQWLGACFGSVAKRWILGDGVGLGKTRTMIGWLDLVEAKRVLIVCEAGIVNQFAGEIMELAPHREPINLYRKKPMKNRTWKDTRHILLDHLMSKDEAVVIVNFEAWRNDKDVLAKLLAYRFDTVIVDEAHNLKNVKTANYKNIEMIVNCDNICGNCRGSIKGLFDPEALREVPSRKIPKPCPACGWKTGDRKRVESINPLDDLLLTKSVKNLCLATGTPLLNSPVDLYPLLHLVDPILFKSLSSFQTTFLKLNEFSAKWEFRDGGLRNLKPLIEGRFLARTRDEAGIILPEQAHRVIRVDITKEDYPLQHKVIEQLTEAAQIVLSNGHSVTVFELIALITRKRQANVWPGGIIIKDEDGEIIFSVSEEVTEAAKIDAAMEEIRKRNSEGKRQVVFSQFSTAVDEITERLNSEGIRAVSLTGKTPARLRDRIKSNFDRSKKEKPEWDVVVANYKAGGTGLNMNAAVTTHVLDEEWNPGKRNQAYGRTDRIGQTEENEVLIYRVPNSIDTWMSNIITHKEGIIQGFEDEMSRGQEADISAKALLEAMRRGEVL